MSKRGADIYYSRPRKHEAVAQTGNERAEIAQQTKDFLRSGGKVQKIAQGVSNGADAVANLHRNAATKRRMARLKKA